MFNLGINKIRIIFLVLFVAVLVFGLFYLKFSWGTSLQETSDQALKVATISEIALSGEMFKQLRAIPEDVGTVAYESIKQRLSNLVTVDDNIRFAYIYTKIQDKLYFMADSEPISSKDYSPPGQEYTEASSEYFQPFIDGKSLVTKPVSDRWGKWVSVLVPIKVGGEVKAVFGLDYPANSWSGTALFNVGRNGLVLLTLLVLILTFYFIIKNNIEIRESEKKFRAFTSSVKDAVVVMDGEGKVVSWNKAAEIMFDYSESEMLGKEFHHYISTKKEHEDKKNIIKFGKTGESSVLGQLIELPVKNKGGKEFLIELSVTRIKIDDKWHAIGIMRDITKRKQEEESLRTMAEETKRALAEAEQLNRLTVGRELEMVRLKEELKKMGKA